MIKADREKRLIELWLQRQQNERTMNDILSFYTLINQNYPLLFSGMRGDPYQNLKSVLRNHFRD